MRSFIGLLMALFPACVLAADLVVAHIGPFTGPLADNANGNYIGAKAYIDDVNANGGVNGKMIRLVREDDQYKPAETARLLELVAKRDKPVAFINLLGSANVGLLLKEQTLEKLGIPAIGVTPGAEVLRKPGSPFLFHVHAGDNAQFAKMLEQLSTIGIKKIAIVYQNLPFGTAGLAFLEQAAPTMGLKIVGKVPMAGGQNDAIVEAAVLAKAGAQSYIMVLGPGSAASFVREARVAGDMTPIYSMSYVPPASIIERAGLAGATGIALTQTMPNPDSSATGLVRQYRSAMKQYAPAGTPSTSFALVGYLAALVTVEGLKHAGSSPTPATLVQALNKIQDLELGGYTIDFSEGNRVGAKYVNIGVVDRNGKLMY